MVLFRRYWHSSAVSSVLQPMIFLLGLGLGLGVFLDEVAGYRYIDFLATGIVAMGTMMSAAFPAMYNTYIRREFQKSYDAILAAPIDVHEMVAAESLTIAVRAGIYGSVPVAAAIPLGLRPGPAALLVPLICVLTGLGFALFGAWMSAIVPAIDTFNYVNSAVLTPLFMVAGTFFPIESLPRWAFVAAQVNPLYHCVELVRHATFGLRPGADLGHLAALLIFVALMWLLAVRSMRRKLID
ncbi:MAG: ABC transporter [Streptosporangiales bacterium]|nr:ABC transporter [Streptosporangiales bacterium]